jgi:ferric-dicitrate binding protein FerR (iron transport regulator)
LHLAVIEFIQKMNRLRMPEHLEYALPQALRVLQYFKEASDHALEVEHMMAGNHIPEAVQSDIHRLSQELYHVSNACESEWVGFDIEKVNRLESQLETTYNEVKMSILSAGSRMKLDVQTMLNLHDLIRNYKRVADQLSKAARYMDDFNKLLEHEPADSFNH